MSDRDELALELFIGDNGNQPRESSIQDWRWFEVTGKQQGQVEHYKAMADHILVVGYRKPRTITTAEELEALPDDSIIRDSAGDVAEKRGGVWCSYETAPMTNARLAKYTPITVIYEPEATL